MRLGLNVFASLLLLASGSIAHAQSTDRTLAVFVTAAPVPNVAGETPERRASALADAGNARKALERSLKAEFGDKRERWPAEAQERLRAADEAVGLAAVRHEFGGASEDKLADAVQNVKDGLTGAGLRVRVKNVVLVDEPSKAHLIVEIQDRAYSAGSGGLFGGVYSVLFTVTAGPKLTAEQFRAIPRTYRHNALVARPMGPGAPLWLWKAVGNGSWRYAGTVVASLVDQFVKAHYDALATR